MSRRAGAPGAARRAPRAAGAGESFELFSETLLTGVVVALLSLPLVTALPAVAAGTEHLRRHRAGRASGVRVLLHTARAALRGSWAVSAAVLAALALLGFNALVASGAGLPGGGALRWVMAALATALLVVAFRAAATWSPGASWRRLVAAAARRSAADAGGSVLVATAVGFVVLVAWMLPPLALPGTGILVLGLLAVETRAARAAA